MEYAVSAVVTVLFLAGAIVAGVALAVATDNIKAKVSQNTRNVVDNIAGIFTGLMCGLALLGALVLTFMSVHEWIWR